MNVLSLFDGISCGRVALEKAGIKVDNYFSSEIDETALKIANDNYQQDLKNRLGNVLDVKAEDLPKIDLLIGGSPCQGFSFAGKQKGASTKCNIEITTLDEYLKLKADGFKFDGQSYLVWEFVRLLKELKPKHFFLENTRMSEKWVKVISEALEVESIAIDSKIVSAGLRKRLYWTNIKVEKLEQSENIALKDILESGQTDKSKAYCITQHRGNARDYFCKSQTNLVYEKSTTGKYEVKDGLIKMQFPKSKNPNMMHTFKTKIENGLYNLRPFTATESARVHGLPDNYVKAVSEAQGCLAIGNSWTIQVITYFFKGVKNGK